MENRLDRTLFQEIKQEIDSHLAKIKKYGQDKINIMIKTIFDNVPELQCITWYQYIPRFNDGDVCEFSFGDILFLTAPDADGEWTEEGTHVDSIKNDIIHEFEDILFTYREFIEQIFGSNSKIIYFRNGELEVQEYDCGY